MKRSRRYRELTAQHPNSRCATNEAVVLLKKMANAHFDESVDMAINLNLKRGQSVRDSVRLPHSFGATRTIVVLARGDSAREATKAGATFVGDADLINKIKDGWLDFDVVIATPEIMKEVAPLGPILGRRGMMPNPKSGTVTMDISRAVADIQKGKREFRADKAGVVHLSVAKISMPPAQIIENMENALTTVKACRPDGHKGVFIHSAFASTTMGPSVALNIEELLK